MHKLATIFSSCAFVLSAMPGAFAQSSDASAQLEEIIVTAEKRAVDLQKTPISIQVYNGEELKKQGKRRIDEIMDGVIGVQSQDSQVGSTFSIRGVDTGSAGGGPAEQSGATVAVLIDGVYQSRGETVRGGTLDVSQVEVMRGTQSTTLGVNALAGAVSLVTNKPVFEYQASGSLEAGNYHLINMEGVLNVPLTSNQAVRFAYSSNKRDGYLSSGAGNSDLTNARLKYRIQASSDVDIVLTASHQNIGGNGVTQGALTQSGTWVPYLAANAGTYIATMGYPPIFGLAPGPSFRNRSNPWDDGYPQDVWPNNPFRDTNIDDYNAEINWNTGIGTLTILPSAEHAHFRSAEPPRGTGTGFMGEDRVQNTQQLDVRLASDNASKVQWLAGLYYYYTNFSGTFTGVDFPNDGMYAGDCPDLASSASTNCYSWSRENKDSVLTQSAYGNVTYPIVSTLRLLGGLRYSNDKKIVDTSGNVEGTAIGPSTPFTYGHKTASWSAVTYRAGLEYDVLPQSMLYLTYATGYQPGAVDTMSNMGAGGPPTPKNTSDQFTLGFKSRFFDNKLQFNTEAFLLKYKNRPFDPNFLTAGNTSTTACAAVTGTTSPLVAADYSCLNLNGIAVTEPNQQSKGIDIDINFLPSAADRLDLTLEWLNATLESAPAAPTYTTTDIVNAAVLQGGTANASAASSLLNLYNAKVASYAGVTLQNAPKYSGNLTYEHRFTFAGGSSLAPRLNVAYKSAYWAQGGGPAPAGFDVRSALDEGSLARQDAYFLWNAFATWAAADSKFTVTGYVKNIQNKPVQLNLGGEPGSSVLYVSLDAPRTFGVVLSASF